MSRIYLYTLSSAMIISNYCEMIIALSNEDLNK